MKFIGQYIQDFIARFRSDVYLEDISTGTIASGANLGLDSNNKIVKNTVSGGTTDLTSDVTGVLPIANGGTNSNSAANARTALGVYAAGTDNSTNVTLTGTPDYITLSGQEITRNQIDLTADVTGVLPVANTAAKVTSIVAGDGIDVSGATGDVTVTAETATDSNPGVVELATTGEADTGTDTSRAVTPAGLKSHVDARIIPWFSVTGQFNPASSTSYYAPNNQGAFNTGWTATGTSGGVDYFVDGTDQVVFFKQNGLIVPSACTLVSMRGYVRYGVSKSYKFKILQLAAGDIKYNTNGTVQATAICESTVTFSDNNTSRYAPMSFDGSVSLAQGDMIIPMIKNTDGDYSANTHFSFSFSIKV